MTSSEKLASRSRPLRAYNSAARIGAVEGVIFRITPFTAEDAPFKGQVAGANLRAHKFCKSFVHLMHGLKGSPSREHDTFAAHGMASLEAARAMLS